MICLFVLNLLKLHYIVHVCVRKACLCHPNYYNETVTRISAPEWPGLLTTVSQLSSRHFLRTGGTQARAKALDDKCQVSPQLCECMYVCV